MTAATRPPADAGAREPPLRRAGRRPAAACHTDAGCAPQRAALPALQAIYEARWRAHADAFAAALPMGGSVGAAAATIAAALERGGKMMLCGNGGSAADCQHLAAEFVGRFSRERRPLAALALTTDSSALTAIGNDYGFADIYARQIDALAHAGDCLLGISTSGESENVVRAFESARSRGVTTIGLLGRGGGRMLPLCDFALTLAVSDTSSIQEVQLFVEHTLCALVEHVLGIDR